ncbi:MAG: hypothetical protein ACE145_13055 [Terriglobia bacterium]
MTRNNVLMTALLAVAVVLTASSPAYSSSNSCQVNFPTAGTLNGTPLAAGQYNITWQAHSPALTVTVAQAKKVVATVQGKMEERSSRFRKNMVVYTERADGSRVINEIRVGGTNRAIVFNE